MPGSGRPAAVARGTGRPWSAGRAPGCRARWPAGRWPAPRPRLSRRSARRTGAADRAGPRWRCCPWRRGRTGSRRYLPRSRPAPRRRARPRRSHWRSPCSGCCGSASAAEGPPRRWPRRRRAPGPGRIGDADGVGQRDLVELCRHAAAEHISSTRSWATSPSNGQPKATETVTVVRSPAARARVAFRLQAAICSLTVAPWLRWPNRRWRSTTTLASSTRRGIARSRPRSFSTRPIRDADPRGRAAISPRPSAICGTRAGFTKLVASIRRTPAAARCSMSSSFASVLRTASSFCSPSLGATSTICTDCMQPIVPPCSAGLSSPWNT